jgi:hypothetical protein
VGERPAPAPGRAADGWVVTRSGTRQHYRVDGLSVCGRGLVDARPAEASRKRRCEFCAAAVRR